MNKEYWEEFYKKHRDMTPSSFAAFCKKWIAPKDKVVDVGCGNGRDTYFLNDYAKTEGVDRAVLPELLDTKFYKLELSELLKKPCKYSVVYSRFFLHAIADEEIDGLLRWCNGLFLAEFRVVGDSPKVFTGHERNFINTKDLLQKLHILGYDVIYFEKGRGLAKYKNEDPLIGRIVARKI